MYRLDLCAVNPMEPNYIYNLHGQQWVKFNYDSGAATIALPAEMAEVLPLVQQGEFKVASGDSIPNMGKIKIEYEDEFGSRRRVKGNIAHVRKPPLSAGEANHQRRRSLGA